jgi:phosphoribosylaminoimidazole-succinocarboxamide synthase
MNVQQQAEYSFPYQTAFYSGKVRNVYTITDKYLVMIASNRISAFDVILPRAIPYKGQVLNQIAAYFLQATKDIVPNWLLEVSDPCASIGLRCDAFPVEMVVRGYLAGHAWREYKSGKRILCGVSLPEGLKENDPLPFPIITPTTKAHEGHDEDISAEEIISKGLVSETDYRQLEKYALALFKKGQEMALDKKLILVDTKYEFGKLNDVIYLIDEIHTPDSSRYFYADGYEERQARAEEQKQLSKEFVRQWLIENNFQGKDGQVIPEMSDEKCLEISNRYIELYEHITGLEFIKSDESTAYERINQNIIKSITKFVNNN